MISSKIRVKVQSVKAVKDPENRECYQIDFIEVRKKPPVLMMSNPGVPEEINQMIIQVTKGLQGVLPGTVGDHYEQKKLTLILTGDELESFNLKPYPNQIIELIITEGRLQFRNF